jgi:hypothetical protein
MFSSAHIGLIVLREQRTCPHLLTRKCSLYISKPVCELIVAFILEKGKRDVYYTKTTVVSLPTIIIFTLLILLISMHSPTERGKCLNFSFSWRFYLSQCTVSTRCRPCSEWANPLKSGFLNPELHWNLNYENQLGKKIRKLDITIALWSPMSPDEWRGTTVPGLQVSCGSFLKARIPSKCCYDDDRL